MKTFLISLLYAFTGMAAYAQSTVSISGHIDHPKGNMVYVKYYHDFVTYAEMIADSAIIDQQGHFRMTFSWPLPGPADFSHGDEITAMYLCPGDVLTLHLDTRQFDETVTYGGENSTINAYLAARYLRFSDESNDQYGKDELPFTTYMDSLLNAKIFFLDSFFSKKSSTDDCVTAFLAYEHADLRYANYNDRMRYPMLHQYMQGKRGKAEVSDQYYDFVRQTSYYDDAGAASFHYYEYLESRIQYEMNRLMKEDPSLQPNQAWQQVVDEHLKGHPREITISQWIENKISLENDIESASAMLATLKKEFPHSSFIPPLEETIAIEEGLTPGHIAPNIIAEDLLGHEVSLQDFRGKVIYLDFWATWCGPCVAEIPHLDELISSFEGKDVVFVSISLDEDPGRWKKMVQTKSMKGVHLNSPGNFDAPVAKQYHITAIPRYMIIDASGVIVDTNADRPSMGVKSQLDNILGH